MMMEKNNREVLQPVLDWIAAKVEKNVARVAFSIFAFIEERDRLYVAVTLVVLGVLLYSIVGGYV